jgi:hypothetical protein
LVVEGVFRSIVLSVLSRWFIQFCLGLVLTSRIPEISSYPRLCVFTYECFVFLWRVTSPSAKPPFLENKFVSLISKYSYFLNESSINE